jgi:hypothetical protein
MTSAIKLLILGSALVVCIGLSARAEDTGGPVFQAIPRSDRENRCSELRISNEKWEAPEWSGGIRGDEPWNMGYGPVTLIPPKTDNWTTDTNAEYASSYKLYGPNHRRTGAITVFNDLHDTVGMKTKNVVTGGEIYEPIRAVMVFYDTGAVNPGKVKCQEVRSVEELQLKSGKCLVYYSPPDNYNCLARHGTIGPARTPAPAASETPGYEQR